MIKVSVIITTYKRASMLKRAIDSILNQTYPNIEVIVVDDNNDGDMYRTQTESLMNNYSNYESVKYIKHKKNLNGAAARNTGIKESTGEIVTFLDDDDWYMPEKVEKQVNFLLENPEFKAVYCGWKRNGKISIPSREGNLEFYLLNGESLIYTNTIMMWKNVSYEIGGWDERFKRNQEAVFLLRYFKYGYKIGIVKEALVEFDISDRGNALDSVKNEEVFELYLKSHEETIQRLCMQNKNAKKIIYSLRYRGVFISHLKNKKLKDGIRVYLKMMKFAPIRFNKDIINYVLSKLLKKRIVDY